MSKCEKLPAHFFRGGKLQQLKWVPSWPGALKVARACSVSRPALQGFGWCQKTALSYFGDLLLSTKSYHSLHIIVYLFTNLVKAIIKTLNRRYLIVQYSYFLSNFPNKNIIMKICHPFLKHLFFFHLSTTMAIKIRRNIWVPKSMGTENWGLSLQVCIGETASLQLHEISQT